MIELIDKMLEELHFTRDLIDDILLVGGSSQIPGLVAALKKEYGTEKVRLHERPLLAIAEGAALLCHRLSEKVECPGCAKESPQTAALCPHCGFNLEKEVLEHGVLDIVHSAAHDYSIQLENNMRHLLIKKNSPLPCEVGESFELVNPEQKLVHLKFFNTVNDREAVIGELWLGLAEDLLEKIPDRKKPLNIDLTFRVDENNIIGVTAAMKEFPEVKISRTLSRGYADEKLFFSLEELINDANQKKYSHYSTLDLEYRALAIIRDLNNILQTDTGLVNEEIYRRAVLKIETAAKFLSTDESSKPVIFYAQHLLERFGILLPPRVQEDIKKCIARLEKMEETGTYEENLSACRQLHEAVDEKKIGFSTLLMQIDKAAEFCSGENPSGSAKLYGDIEKIIEFATRREKEKIDSLLNEIMPEVNRIIEVHEEKPITIHKDITR